jgi:soluble cytochrome b562
LLGFTKSLEAGRSVENTYQVFHKKSELLYALVFNPLAKVTKEQGLPLKVYEMAAHEKKFKTVQNTLVADPGEVICINDLLKEVAGASSSESGYAKGMKGWQNSFQNYIEKLQVIEKRLRAGSLSKEELRQVKEIIINFPSSFAEDNSATLEEKFITANIVNLMTSVYKFSRTQDKTLNLIPAPSK